MAYWQEYQQPNLGLLFYKHIYKEDKILNRLKADKNEVKPDEKITPFDNFYTNLYNTKGSSSNYIQPPLKNLRDFNLFTTYPGMLCGTGYGHDTGAKGDFKIGFFFDHTTGQPILPGSSVKGVLRSLFELDVDAKGNENTGEKSVKALQFIFKEAIEQCQADELKAKLNTGLQSLNEASLNIIKQAIFGGQDKIGADIFFDAVINFETLGNEKFLSNDFITPHQPNLLKNPIPLMFLKVMPNVPFQFRFKLSDEGWEAEVKEALFKTMLLTIGAGAKTNVGYGQFSETEIKGNEITNNSNHENSKQSPMRDPKEIHKDKFVPKEGLEPKKEVFGIVAEIRGDNLVFEPLISDYNPEKLPSVQAGNLVKEVKINHLIEVKVSKVKPDGTFTFKDAKKVNIKSSKK